MCRILYFDIYLNIIAVTKFAEFLSCSECMQSVQLMGILHPSDSRIISLTQNFMLMKVFVKLSVLTSLLMFCGVVPVSAQGRGKISFKGTVQASGSEEGGEITLLAYAVVSLPEIGVATTTDVKGRFEIQLSNPGKYKVEVSFLDYEPLSQILQLLAWDSLKFALKATYFYLENIIVSAESKKTGATIASKISKSAMKHIQSTSLTDIISRLPEAGTRTSDEIALKQVSAFSSITVKVSEQPLSWLALPSRIMPICKPCRWH